jgi:hypothetical protein
MHLRYSVLHEESHECPQAAFPYAALHCAVTLCLTCFITAAARRSDSAPVTMLPKLLVAGCLLALTVTIHAAGLAAALRYAQVWRAGPDTQFWSMTWLLIRVAWWLILVHLMEIAVWAMFYWWQECLPDAESSFYFSGVTYATVGYGDLVLPIEWRLLGPVEGLAGILMCGLSTGFFFAVVIKVFGVRSGFEPK